MSKEENKNNFFAAKISLIALTAVFGIILVFGLTCAVSIEYCAQNPHTKGGIFGVQTAVVSDNIFEEYDFNETVLVKNVHRKDLKAGDYVTYGKEFNKSLNDSNFGVIIMIIEGENMVLNVTRQYGNVFVPIENYIGVVSHTSIAHIAWIHFLCSPYMYALFIALPIVCLIVCALALVYLNKQKKNKLDTEPTNESENLENKNLSKVETNTDDKKEKSAISTENKENNISSESENIDKKSEHKKVKKKEASIDGYAQVTIFDMNEKKEKKVDKKIIISKTAEKAIVEDAIKPKKVQKTVSKPQEYSLIIAKPRPKKENYIPVPKSKDNVPLKEILSKSTATEDNDARRDLLDKMRNKIIY